MTLGMIFNWQIYSKTETMKDEDDEAYCRN